MRRAPRLEMLWENRDPRVELPARFGFGDSDAAARWVRTTIRRQWGVLVDSCERIVMSDHNALAWVTSGADQLVLKWSVARPRFARLGAVASLTERLAAQGLPVSAPRPALDGRLQVEIDGASANLQRHVAGDLLDTRDLAQVRAAGRVLADLHHALANSPESGRVLGLEAPTGPLTEQLTAWLDRAPAHLPSVALRRLQDSLPTTPPPAADRQLVHGDFRAANVIVDQGTVVAVLDFEEARIDHPVVELARSAVLLGTRFHDWGPVPGAVHRAVLDGYRSVRRLTSIESAWWGPLLLWQTLALVPEGEDPTGWTASALTLRMPPSR